MQNRVTCICSFKAELSRNILEQFHFGSTFTSLSQWLWALDVFCFLRKKTQTNKASCADQNARSIAGGVVSPGMLLRVWEPVSQGGEMQFTKNKRQNFQRQKLLCFKKTLLSSELKFVLLHRRLLVCQDMGIRRNTRICL